MIVTLTLPIRAISEANQREHWAKKAKRVKQHRRIAAMVARMYTRGVVLPAVVTMIRIIGARGRKLDSDNLASSMKAVRDGIADAFRVDDGGDMVRWEYRQLRAVDGVWSVWVLVEDQSR